MDIHLFVPCYIDALTPEVGMATVTLLERLGHRVIYREEQTCCGQPAFNAGHWSEAKALAQRFVRLFDQASLIVTPSGSCASMVRNHFPRLLGPHRIYSRTYELTELLVRVLNINDVGASFPGRVGLHRGCHFLRELGAADCLDSLLQSVAGLDVVPLTDEAGCCGFGGTFSVKFPELSARLGEARLEALADLGLDTLVSTDSSCLMHLKTLAQRRHRDLRVLHVAQILAGGPL